MANPELVEYGAEYKFGSDVGRFGFGTFWGSISPKLPEEQIVARAIRLGWSSGCPRVKELIQPDSYGADWMMRRYSVCNWMFREVSIEAYKNNQPIFNQLTKPTPRKLPEEPLGIHERLSVPNSHKEIISPMSSLYGYAIPRLILMRRDSHPDGIKSEQNSNRATVLMRVNVSEAKTLPGLLASLANDLSHENDLERAEILSHILPQGILEEENCYTTYSEFVAELIETAPELFKVYQELTPSQRKELGVINLSTLLR